MSVFKCKFLIEGERGKKICTHSQKPCDYPKDPEGQKICESLTKSLIPAVQKPKFADDKKVDRELMEFYKNHGIPLPKNVKPAP